MAVDRECLEIDDIKRMNAIKVRLSTVPCSRKTQAPCRRSWFVLNAWFCTESRKFYTEHCMCPLFVRRTASDSQTISVSLLFLTPGLQVLGYHLQDGLNTISVLKGQGTMPCDLTLCILVSSSAIPIFCDRYPPLDIGNPFAPPAGKEALGRFVEVWRDISTQESHRRAGIFRCSRGHRYLAPASHIDVAVGRR